MVLVEDASLTEQVQRPVMSKATSAVVVLAIAVANMSNYAFQIVTGRALGPNEYGLLGGLMAVVAVIGVSLASVQTVAARAIASGRSQPRRALIDPLTRSTLLLCLVVSVGVLAASPLFADFLNVGTLPVAFLALYIAPAAVASIATGRFQGMERFAAMAWYSTALALGKIAVALVVLAVGLRVTGIMGALVLSVTAIGALGLWFSRDAGSVASGIFSPDVRRAFIALTLFWAIVSMDLPLARASLNEHDAGIYVAASVMAKAVLWLPAAVAQIAFPRLAHLSSRGEAATPLMARGLALTFGLAASGVIGLYVLGGPLFSILYGDEYHGASHIAWKLGLAFLPFALANLLIYLRLARDANRFLLYLLAIAILEPLCLLLVNASANAFAVVIGSLGVVLLVALVPATASERALQVLLRRRPVDTSVG